MQTLIDDKLANRFYQQLLPIGRVEDKFKPNQIMKLGSLLENVFRTATRESLPSNSRLFDRMDHVFASNSFETELVKQAHELRMLTNNIRHNGHEPNLPDFRISFQAVAECICAFSGVEVPEAIKEVISGNASGTSEEAQLSSNSQLSISEQDLIDNPTPRLPVALVLDASSSMRRDDKIGQLNKGIQAFVDSILSDDVARFAVELSVISFGKDKEVNQLIEFASIDSQEKQLRQLRLTAYGNTPMGGAVNKAIDVLETRKQQYKESGVEYYQPWLVLLTDGQPTDSIEIASKRSEELTSKKKLSFYSVAIGDGANLQTLSRFCSKRSPLRLKGLNFTEFFEWLSQSTKTTSQSAIDDVIKLPDVSGWAEV